jgi:hypothetical protein
VIVAVVLQILFVALIIFGVFRLFARGGRRGSGDFSIRRIFQYLLLLLTLVIAGLGVTGLLGRTLDFGQVIAESRTGLARDLAFTIVGVPLLYAFGRWTMRTITSNPNEARAFSFNAYLTVTSITSLAIALNGAHDFLSWALGSDPYRGASVARLLIWGLIWVLHLRISNRISHAHEREPHFLIGSGIGLVILAVGIGGLFGNVLEKLINLNDEISVIQRTDPVINSAITILVGLPVWYFYWFRHALHAAGDFLWNAYVLLVGIAANFITAVVSLSIVGYDVLVWFFGNPASDSAAKHFFDTANSVGSAAIALFIWWYHRAILHSEVSAERVELRRVYEYLISGISLIAASLGLLMIIVAAIESVTPGELVSGSSGTNTLILAITLLVVGAPIWWYFWQRIERYATTTTEELASPTRRIFLFMLFGISAVAAVVSVITTVFLFLDDLLNSNLSGETVRSMRFAIGILLNNGALAGYHWSIYRHERTTTVHLFERGRKIVLVGPADESLVKELKSRVGGDIELWATHDGEGAWSVPELVDLIQSTEGKELLILNEKKKLRVNSVTRI